MAIGVTEELCSPACLALSTINMDEDIFSITVDLILRPFFSARVEVCGLYLTEGVLLSVALHF